MKEKLVITEKDAGPATKIFKKMNSLLTAKRQSKSQHS